MKNLLVILAALMAAGLLIACGGGGGSSSPSGSSATLSIVSKDTSASSLQNSKPERLAMSTGDAGSFVNSQMGEITKFELQKDDLSWVTVYNTVGFLEFVGRTGQEMADTLLGTLPPAGTYVAARMTGTRIKFKGKLVTGGSTYYTTLQNRAESEVWAFSTNPDEHDYVTFTFGAPSAKTVTFPTPLVVTGSQNVNIYMVSERTGTVECDGSIPNTDITYCSPGSLVDVIMPLAPETRVRFDAIATNAPDPELRNTFTAFFGSLNEFLGFSVHRPSNKYINAGGLYNGTAIYNATDSTYTFDVRVLDSDTLATEADNYRIQAVVDCTGGISASFSSLSIVNTPTAETWMPEGYTLASTGIANCTQVQ